MADKKHTQKYEDCTGKEAMEIAVTVAIVINAPIHGDFP